MSHQRKRRQMREGELWLILSCIGTTRPSKEAVVWRCSVKKAFLEISQNSQENTCARVSFLKKVSVRPAVLLKRATLAQVFFCDFCEISRNTFYDRTPLVAASASRPTRSFYRTKRKTNNYS